MMSMSLPYALPTLYLRVHRKESLMFHPFNGTEACAGMNTDLFFLPDGARHVTKRQRVEAAKAVCNTCPIMQACLAYAKRQNGTVGVWGGQLFDGLGFISQAPIERKELAA